MFKKGFTLAEVLITLAIIGIVAALTIPTLVQNFQSKAWDTASTVFQRKLEESLKVMNTQGTLAGYSSTEAFVNELSKHIKITKVCKNDDITSCFADKVYWGAENEEIDMTKIKTSKNFGQDNWDTETIGLQFANGVNAVVAYNPDCHQDPYSNQIIGSDCLAILYDVDGFKNPNTSGKDLRSINVKKLANNCAFEIGGTCFTAPFAPKGFSTSECAELIAEGKVNVIGCGAVINADDYWLGAVLTCGGKDKMPTNAQLQEISDYISASGPLGAAAKAEELGFKIHPSSRTFYLWSGEEQSKLTTYVYRYYFGGGGYEGRLSTYSYKHIAPDSLNTYTYAVCIE